MINWWRIAELAMGVIAIAIGGGVAMGIALALEGKRDKDVRH